MPEIQPTSPFLKNFKATISDLSFTAPRRTMKDTCLKIFSQSILFLWEKTLQLVYDSPFWVINKAEKYFTIERNGHTDNISINKLKQAHVNLPKQTSKPQNSYHRSTQGRCYRLYQTHTIRLTHPLVQQIEVIQDIYMIINLLHFNPSVNFSP